MKLSQQSIDFIKLIQRAPDIGEGWRQSDPLIYRFVREFPNQELLERDDERLRVRLSSDGLVLARYL